MATVFVGRARGAVGFSRLVAIKRPHGFVSSDRDMRRGLEQEARVASLIHHPHVVSVLDVELLGDELALILDYVEGGTLEELSKHAATGGPGLPIRVALRILLDAASGLHAAHVLRDGAGAPLGIVHRDVSPQNILVGLDGQSRLTDFGIAKIAENSEHTASGIIKGKLGYLPPEYVVSREFGPRSDEYALAVVAWEILAGRRMFDGVNDAEVVRQVVGTGAAPLLSTVRSELAPLDAVISRGLARHSHERFDSVAAFADELEARAREHGWVATHGEVGALVEKAVGEKVRRRRSAIETGREPVSSVKIAPVRPTDRDVVVTQSLPGELLGAAERRPSSPPPPVIVAPASPPTEGTPQPDTTLLDETKIHPLEEPARARSPSKGVPTSGGGGAARTSVPPPSPGGTFAEMPTRLAPLDGWRGRWWPGVALVVVAAAAGFAITRGVLRPARPTSSASPEGDDASTAIVVIPVPAPPSDDDASASGWPHGFIGGGLRPPVPPASGTASTPPAASTLPTQVRQDPRAPPSGRTPQRGRHGGAAPSVTVIPAHAPPNPYAP